MNAVTNNLMSYTVFRQRQRAHFLRQYEIPTEHAVSLPLPTLRWGEPAYAAYASPALRTPGQPTDQSAPDRWWAIAALGGSLLIYARTKAVPFADQSAFARVTLPPPIGTVEDMRNAVQNIEQRMDAVVMAFFAGEPGDANARRELLTALEGYLPAPLLPQYRALAPDFFAWLSA